MGMGMGGNGKADLGKKWEWECCDDMGMGGNGNGSDAMGVGGSGNLKTHSRTPLPDMPYCVSLIADRRHSLFGHICRLPENTPASQALQLSIEAHTMALLPPLTATSGKRHWPICWCCPDRGPGSFDVEDATTLSWSSAAVSE